MAIERDHSIVPSRPRDASGRRLAALLGVRCGPARAGSCFAVDVNDGPTLDFIATEENFSVYHHCFRVTEDRFQPMFDRILAAGIPYRSSVAGPFDLRISTHCGGRMGYWNEPDGHQR